MVFHYLALAAFYESLPPWAGTVPGWITAIGASGSFGLLCKLWVDNKRAKNEENKVEGDIEARLREHFSLELDRLTNIAKSAEDGADAAKSRQRQCEEREEKLRLRVRKLEDQLTGIVRSLSVEGSLRVLDLTTEPSDHIIEAAVHSLEAILTKRREPTEEGPKLDPPRPA